MRLRNIATAFLMNGNDILMMKRSERKRIAPGYWYGVGGHFEPAEIGNPRAACLREIREEAGFDESSIHGLSLRYQVMRRSRDELVINYFFFGWTNDRSLTESEEGTLHWVPREQALDRRLFPAIGLTLKRFLEETDPAGPGEDADRIQVGLVCRIDGEPAIEWHDLLDWADPA